MSEALPPPLAGGDSGGDFSNDSGADGFVVDGFVAGQDHDAEDGDIALGALEAARQMTSKGVPGGQRRPVRRRRTRDATYSGARSDSRDPTSIGAVLRQASDTLGWSTPLARARVLGQWQELVGPEIASRCTPMSLTESVLRVSAESTSWATQLRLMTPQILARVSASLPPGTVTKIVFSGPSGPSWRKGPWSMSGGRGVRDTYG